MRLWLAVRAFCATLFQAEAARRVEQALSHDAAPEPAVPPAPQDRPAPPAPRPTRNDALALLAALQREARLIDIVQEPLTDYSDAQIGAAARDVLRDCGKVFDRCFALQPAAPAEEGAELQTPAEVDAGIYRLTGNVGGDPPFRGRLVHPGWRATRCDLPQWSGSSEAAMIVAPIELEVS